MVCLNECDRYYAAHIESASCGCCISSMTTLNTEQSDFRHDVRPTIIATPKVCWSVSLKNRGGVNIMLLSCGTTRRLYMVRVKRIHLHLLGSLTLLTTLRSASVNHRR